ncbi:MAG: hypothetical protein ACLFVE_15720 [Chitinispirillaceae bacterium]
MEMSGSSRKRAKDALPPETFETPQFGRQRYHVREAELEHVTPEQRETEEGKVTFGGDEEKFRDARHEIEERLEHISTFEDQITGLVGKIDEEKNTIRRLIEGM